MPTNNTPVSLTARKRVAQRASYICEYCLEQDENSFIGFEIDHIISRKHKGSNDESNLAYTCPDCNRNKGTDIASIDWSSQEIVRFFNPRTDIWAEHFRLSGGFIEPLTPIGKVTVDIFRFNDRVRLPDKDVF
ncbi:HNH endonuclease [Spirosoma soli]|uniref:HNH endonuclease n=1 Tax=Spirosoma soli TaxID=1770529 RepID=A0ABW5MCF7_9BACT